MQCLVTHGHDICVNYFPRQDCGYGNTLWFIHHVYHGKYCLPIIMYQFHVVLADYSTITQRQIIWKVGIAGLIKQPTLHALKFQTVFVLIINSFGITLYGIKILSLRRVEKLNFVCSRWHSLKLSILYMSHPYLDSLFFRGYTLKQI